MRNIQRTIRQGFRGERKAKKAMLLAYSNAEFISAVTTIGDIAAIEATIGEPEMAVRAGGLSAVIDREGWSYPFPFLAGKPGREDFLSRKQPVERRRKAGVNRHLNHDFGDFVPG